MRFTESRTHFDAHLTIEAVASMAEADASTPLRSRTLLRALAARAADGRPLGAKGLFPELHGLLHDELLRRGSKLFITNRPTDWIFLRHPSLPSGSLLRYRIRTGLAELRFRGKSVLSVQSMALLAPPDLAPVTHGTELCFQRTLAVGAQAFAGDASASDIIVIAECLDQLVEWFESVVSTS